MLRPVITALIPLSMAKRRLVVDPAETSRTGLETVMVAQAAAGAASKLEARALTAKAVKVEMP